MATVTLKGNPVEVAGTFPKPGQKASGFTLVANDACELAAVDFPLRPAKPRVSTYGHAGVVGGDFSACGDFLLAGRIFLNQEASNSLSWAFRSRQSS